MSVTYSLTLFERKFSAEQMLEYTWFMMDGVGTYSKAAP